MKILMVGPGRRDKGGIATVVNQYYDAGIEEIVDVRYVTMMHDGNKIYKLLTAFRGYLTFLFWINRYDLVHVHMSSRASFSRKRVIVNLAHLLKKKIIIHMHGSEFDTFYEKECDEKKKNRVRDTFAKADMVIALSEEWKVFFDGICAPDKVRVLYNAVILPTYRRDSVQDHKMLFLGRLGKRKGIYDLLRVMPAIIEKIPDAHFYFGGDGEIDQTLKMIEELKLQSHVSYLGWVNGEKKTEILKKCSVFVLPSYHEGMPMSILEAMSYSEIVVSTYVGGIPKVIQHGINGYLFEAGDLEGLQSVLEEALTGEQRVQVSENAYQTIEKSFNVSCNLMILKEWYETLM